MIVQAIFLDLNPHRFVVRTPNKPSKATIYPDCEYTTAGTDDRNVNNYTSLFYEVARDEVELLPLISAIHIVRIGKMYNKSFFQVPLLVMYNPREI